MPDSSSQRVARLLRNTAGLRFHVVNQGCKVNKVEADSLESTLVSCGAVRSDPPSAQLVIVNTCTVTGEADKKARKAVRHALRTAPDALVLVTGCGAAIHADAFSQLGGRVSVVTRQMLEDMTASQARSALRLGEDFRTRVGIKVQDGCDHACTYCIVHVARGRARSFPLESIVAEAGSYFKAGVKELVLTGIDLGSYRYGSLRLHDLVNELLRLADLCCPEGQPPARVRASSLEPMTISDEFIALLAESDGRLCRHLHLPLQSGSSKVLRQMARPYSAQDFANLVQRLYAAIPQLALTTDVIVGFPGETDDDFEKTKELVRQCRFSKVHVFPYSRREGTPAAARADQVDPQVMRARAAELRSIADELRNADLLRRAGTHELAIVEEGHALSESYHQLAIPRGAETGQLVQVEFPVIPSSSSTASKTGYPCAQANGTLD